MATPQEIDAYRRRQGLSPLGPLTGPGVPVTPAKPPANFGQAAPPRGPEGPPNEYGPQTSILRLNKAVDATPAWNTLQAIQDAQAQATPSAADLYKWDAAQMANQTNPYLAQFQSSLGQARGYINQQLGAALGEIAHNRALAGQAIGVLPGQYDQQYAGENRSMDQTTKESAGALQRYGFAGDLGGANLAPERAAVENTHQYLEGTVPQLQLQAQGAMNQQQAAVRGAAMNDLAGLSQSAMGAYGQMAGSYQNNQQNALNNLVQSQIQGQQAKQQMAMALAGPVPAQTGDDATDQRVYNAWYSRYKHALGQ